MKKGGYQILDLKRYALTSGSESNIEGSYSAISNSNSKRIIVSGMTVSDTDYSDFEAYFVASENIYEAAVTIGSSTITITVDSDDDVTVTVAS